MSSCAAQCHLHRAIAFAIDDVIWMLYRWLLAIRNSVAC